LLDVGSVIAAIWLWLYGSWLLFHVFGVEVGLFDLYLDFFWNLCHLLLFLLGLPHHFQSLPA
jgi:hypothetical protein